jgi:hypothetical protein
MNLEQHVTAIYYMCLFWTVFGLTQIVLRIWWKK